MEIWRVGYDTAPRPKVISKRNLAIALGLHISAFALFWFYAACHNLFDKEEEIIPIDLTVVVNQNLDGKDNEPPPLKKEDPEPPKPKPKVKEKVKVKEEKPKELEKIVTNIVTKVDKKVEEKKPEKSKKTKAQLLEERFKKMREAAVVKGPTVQYEVRTAKVSGNGRTEKRPKDWEKLFNDGYKPGAFNQLARNDEQLAISLIHDAFESKWDKPPWTDTLRPMIVRVWFGGGGKVVRYKLEVSSSDPKADQTILSASSRVGSIPGLPASFIEKYRNDGYRVRFTVKPQ